MKSLLNTGTPIFKGSGFEFIDKSLLSESAKENEKVSFIGCKLNIEKKIDTVILNIFIKQYPHSDFSDYYKSLLVNTKFINSIGKNYLVHFDNTKVDFSEVIKRLKGYLIVIDVWASWCAPCREQFESSKEFEKQVAGEKIKFLYLSIDNNLQSWKKACKEEGIINEKLNFLLPDSENSDFLKLQKIKSIPRFLIIDYNGKIINTNIFEKIDSELKKTILDALILNNE